MPIQWYRQPDGTWILWNTEEAQTPPLEAPPATGASISGKTDTTAQAQEMMDQTYGDRADNELSPYGVKLKTTHSDRQYMRQTMRELKSGNLSDDDKTNRAISLLGNKLFNITNEGDVYGAMKHLPGGDEGRQALLGLMRDFMDHADDSLHEAGLDPDKMSTSDIVDFMANQQGWSKMKESKSGE